MKSKGKGKSFALDPIPNQSPELFLPAARLYSIWILTGYPNFNATVHFFCHLVQATFHEAVFPGLKMTIMYPLLDNALEV